MKIIESEDTELSNGKTVHLLANAQENPTERQIKYLYDKWRLSQYGSREENSMIEILKNKMPVLKESGVDLVIKENPFIAVIITPIMRRAFIQNMADEMVYVDSSGSCDQTSTCVTFLFTSNKTGAIPVACVLHTAQTEANYTLAFAVVIEAIEVHNKKFSPRVFMTDDSEAERNALATVFPNSVLLLCTFHLCQALWRYLWETDHNVKKEDRKKVMELFRDVLYAPTEIDSEEHMKNLKKDGVVLGNQLLLKHMENLWTRREEWCISYRKNVITRGNNTNNYTEASIRIFKDIVLQRCKVFNSCALINFIVNVFENYYKRKLLEFANSRRSKPQIDYENMCRRAKEINVIYKMDDTVFHVASEKDSKLFYTINADIAFCDCPSGASANIYVQSSKSLVCFFKTSPILNTADRVQLTKLAVGHSAPDEFYQNMDEEIVNVECPSGTTATVSHVQTISQNVDSSIVNLEENGDGCSRFDEEVVKFRSAFDRLATTLEENQSPQTTLSLIKFNAVLQNLKTPCQIINFMETKNHIRGRASKKNKSTTNFNFLT
ncbi:hypothetical protein NQ314_015609 [Rhamnusium bicolor]|uniref:MULE transposase domain-containing protein n=1 Tax=Rhamnusium bicolor TaxID=1586634 RepID=A0AAV8WYE8_9CUCU|nr:hypothetical protein NQ314_015609 [Rhamnusium bicolor]